MRQILTLLLFAAVFQPALAQHIDLGVSHDHISNGISAIYNQRIGKRVEIGAGLRYLINIYSINANKQDYFYRQNGFAANFREHFGFILRPAVKLYGRKTWGIYLQTNFLLTNHSLKYRNHSSHSASTGEEIPRVHFHSKALGLESTAGLRLYYQLNKQWRIQAAAGVGHVWLNYSPHGRELISGTKMTVPEFSDPYGPTSGIDDAVGSYSLPMLYLGVGYNLNQ